MAASALVGPAAEAGSSGALEDYADKAAASGGHWATAGAWEETAVSWATGAGWEARAGTAVLEGDEAAPRACAGGERRAGGDGRLKRLIDHVRASHRLSIIPYQNAHTSNTQMAGTCIITMGAACSSTHPDRRNREVVIPTCVMGIVS